MLKFLENNKHPKCNKHALSHFGSYEKSKIAMQRILEAERIAWFNLI